ncbi:hypothetical protein RUM44_010656 [Polyplax serrata]|uniref:Uncharacterized protein n=1 Tax=Polyplax serrata TaxID=468196 RepID=A0ABR1AMU3_POLSC
MAMTSEGSKPKLLSRSSIPYICKFIELTNPAQVVTKSRSNLTTNVHHGFMKRSQREPKGYLKALFCPPTPERENNDECLSIVLVGLIVDPTNNGILAFDQNHSGIVYVSWPGYIIINTVLLITHLAGDRVPKRTQILFSFVGGCLFVAAAAVSLEDWRRQHGESLLKTNVQQYSDQTIAAGILALFCALTFFIDVFVTIKFA